MIAVAAMLFSQKWEERGAFHFLTRPEGNVSAAGAKAVHHISEREREIYGIRQKLVLASLMDLARNSREIIAFNLPFASRIIEIELDRASADPTDWIRGGLRRTCAMEAAGQKFNSGRAMKLVDAHEAATGISYDPPARDKHIHDAKAVARIMMEIRR